LDLAFDPFNDDIFATCSEDCTAKIWRIPPGGLANGSQLTEDIQTLKGHKRKVGIVKYHPIVENLIATAGTDYDTKVWDIERGASLFTISGPTNIVQSLDWNYEGSLLCSNSKDKTIRVVDPRQQQEVASAQSHIGVKGGRALWLGKHDKMASVGFGAGASREFMLWDPRNMGAPIFKQALDNAAGVIMPFYDEDADLLFFAGKGDGAIRYFEIAPDEEPGSMVFEGSAYRTNDPTSGCGCVHRRHCNTAQNEIIRLYQTTGTSLRPLCFQVPRKSDLFQADLFPPCRGDSPNLDLASWNSGGNATPVLVDLENGFTASVRDDRTFSRSGDAAPAASSAPSGGGGGDADLRRVIARLEAQVAELQAELRSARDRIQELESQ